MASESGPWSFSYSSAISMFDSPKEPPASFQNTTGQSPEIALEVTGKLSAYFLPNSAKSSRLSAVRRLSIAALFLDLWQILIGRLLIVQTWDCLQLDGCPLFWSSNAALPALAQRRFSQLSCEYPRRAKVSLLSLLASNAKSLPQAH